MTTAKGTRRRSPVPSIQELRPETRLTPSLGSYVGQPPTEPTDRGDDLQPVPRPEFLPGLPSCISQGRGNREDGILLSSAVFVEMMSTGT